MSGIRGIFKLNVVSDRPTSVSRPWGSRGVAATLAAADEPYDEDAVERRLTIVELQTEIMRAQSEAVLIDTEWDQCVRLFDQRRSEHKERLLGLQGEWVKITQDLGIRAEVV
jgi:hypothetical protein